MSWRESKAHFFGERPHVFRAIDPVEFVEHLAAALRLFGFLPGNVLTDEVFGLIDEGLLPLRKLTLARQIGLTCDRVLRVAKRIHTKARSPELHRPIGHRVEE